MLANYQIEKKKNATEKKTQIFLDQLYLETIRTKAGKSSLFTNFERNGSATHSCRELPSPTTIALIQKQKNIVARLDRERTGA